MHKLSLAGNYLKSLHFASIPPTLRLLELYGNAITPEGVQGTPSANLVHVGLGLNAIERIDALIGKRDWSALLSLDVSRNNLSVVEAFCSSR